jgi:2-keto-4-pentenoate hydratase
MESSRSDDQRIARGMTAQLAELARREKDGDRRVGWKIGLNSPAAQRHLGLAGPIGGFLTRSRTWEPGASVSLADLVPAERRDRVRVGVEPEIAIHLVASVPPGADAERAASAIGALGAALEVVALDRDVADIERILAANVFHRGVVFGPARDDRRGGSVSGVSARIYRSGGEERFAAAEDADPSPVEAVRLMADFLGDFGETLAAGDRIIGGSLTEPLWAEPEDDVVVDLGSLGRVDIRFTA